MSAIKEGTTLYASLPYQPFPGREVKVVDMFTPTMLAAYFPIRLTRLQHIYRTRGRGTKYS
jgi:hypothetical protein